MSTDKEQWMNKVFNGLEGMQPAQPDEKLFSKIENQLFNMEAKVIPLYWIRTGVAAAVLVLGVNLYGVHEYFQSNATANEQLTQQSSYELISTYNLYE